MFVECYKVTPIAPEIIPGRTDREWMNNFASRFPYRCLPLTMANSTGWEILCPGDIEVSWNGGASVSDLAVRYIQNGQQTEQNFAVSHFSHGILTFHTGYLFRTPPNIALWVSGAPNHIKDGIQPLTGLVETEWLPMPFTMNWRMTRPGIVNFAKGEPFCFIQMIEHKKMDDVVPIVKNIEDNPELFEKYKVWSTSRDRFNRALLTGDVDATQQGWQRNYFLGQDIPEAGCPMQKIAGHVNKRRLKRPTGAPDQTTE
jgi:Family of unknown function (DUF6065)